MYVSALNVTTITLIMKGGFRELLGLREWFSSSCLYNGCLYRLAFSSSLVIVGCSVAWIDIMSSDGLFNSMTCRVVNEGLVYMCSISAGDASGFQACRELKTGLEEWEVQDGKNGRVSCNLTTTTAWLLFCHVATPMGRVSDILHIGLLPRVWLLLVVTTLAYGCKGVLWVWGGQLCCRVLQEPLLLLYVSVELSTSRGG